MPTLPRFVVVTSNTNGKYLRYVDEDIQNDVQAGYLKFCGQEAGSQYAKFEVEMAKSSGNEGLVHIKCCYNNKYWSRRRPINYAIAAVADEPEEDKSKLLCTLFEPVYISDDVLVDDDKTTNHILVLRLRHAQLRKYLTLCRRENTDNPVLRGGLYPGSTEPDPKLFDVFTVTDWESLFTTLPKHVAFKGHNGNLINRQPYVPDVGDPTVVNEVFASILSYSSGKLWRLTKGDWICLDADNSTSSKRFVVTDKTTSEDQVKELVVSLWSVGVGLFLFFSFVLFLLWIPYPLLSTVVFCSCLNTIVSIKNKIKIKEIYNVTFRLGDARIYNNKDVEIVMGEAVNRTQETQTVELKLSYKKTRSGSLQSSVFKLGVQSSIDGEVPVIADNGKIEVDDFSGSVQRGITGTTTIFTSSVNEVAVYKVVLPAMAMVKVRLLAIKASYDVPFSYTEQDTLAGGEIITKSLDDGFYRGTNTFNFKFETT